MSGKPKLITEFNSARAEELVRARLANNGRNPENKNAGIRVGSDLHLCEMLLKEIDELRAKLARWPMANGSPTALKV